MSSRADDRNPRAQFATTQWSQVLEAGKQDSPRARDALEDLCRAYWYPLYAYVRRRVPDVHEAQDQTQAFFEYLLEHGYLAAADPARGKFRAFLVTAFKHFLSKEWPVDGLKSGAGDAARSPSTFKTGTTGWSNSLPTK